MTCKVNEETINITWRKDGETITERAIIDTRLDEKKSKLALTEFGEEDNGEYSCEARNKPGTVARSVVTVNVKGKLFKQPNIISVINYVRSLLRKTSRLLCSSKIFSSGFLIFWELEI